MAARRGVQESFAVNTLARPTAPDGGLEILGDFPGLSNGKSVPENENPGALAGATGAGLEAANFTGTRYPKRSGNAMSRHAQDRHKRVARMLGYCLTADDPRTWGGLSNVITVRLTPLEIASLAFAALRALEPAERQMVHAAAQWEVA